MKGIIWVDDYRRPAQVGKIVKFWSRLFTYPNDEAALKWFARRLRLRQGGLRQSGGVDAHFNVTDSVRMKAITAGAAQCTSREAAAMIMKMKQEGAEGQ